VDHLAGAGAVAGLIATTTQLAIGGLLADPDNPHPAARMTHKEVNTAVAYTLRDGMAGKPATNFTAPSPQIALAK
jgi:hypothetical protein